MKCFIRLRTILVVLFSVYLIFPQTVYAYLDPGTGSYVLQIIIASLVGAMFAIKIFWHKINIFFKNLFSKAQINGKAED